MIPRRRARFYKGELKDILRLILLRMQGEGGYIESFEKRFADYIGTKHAISTCSGRNAMDLILDSLNLEKGDEIILPAYTLKDLVYLIQKKGLVVKLVDIEEETLNINPRLIEEKITVRTRVVIATHLFGLPCNMEEILEVAKKYNNLEVIEDCTHALGARYKGKRVGGFGKAAFFSFEATKPINTFGGGMIVTDNDGLAAAAKAKVAEYPFTAKKVVNKIAYVYLELFLVISQLFSLLNLFFIFDFTKKALSKFYWYLQSRARSQDSRFTNLQAFLGIKQLAELERRNAERNSIALKLTERLKLNGYVHPQKFIEGRIYYFYVIKADFRIGIEKLRKRLLLRGVDAGIGEEITDNCSPIIGAAVSYPVVKKVFDSAIQLPMFDGLKERDLNHISKVLGAIPK